MGAVTDVVQQVFRREYGRAVAALTAAYGDIDAAEDAVQDAFALAVDRWGRDGIPPAPAGWIITTAKRRAIDRHRREVTRRVRHGEATMFADEPVAGTGPFPDDRLRLMFTCCHPALSPQARVALTLRLLGGLTTPEIARAFLVSEQTMAQRIVRAKAKIRDAGIPYRIPVDADRPHRIRAVLAVVYLIFTEGHTASTGETLVRDDLCEEAIRLGRLLADLMPGEPETFGLLALMLLTHARRPAREDHEGGFIPLAEQDRSRWDRSLLNEGQRIVRRCLRIGRPGPYQIQAAINAVHADAGTFQATDWAQIVRLYDQLTEFDPGPVVALNRAVAVAEVDGPAMALSLVDELDLHGYPLWHAVRADLLRRLGRVAQARQAYDAAIDLTDNIVQQAYLRRHRDGAS